ncbi:nitrate- and nitrite sensing domain-containing protein [Streptomyces sp. NPDC001941]|uniref:sensor histidine kinase n=1 Tax=Streptomyces sp. NPDC001941 TaxID=3154659 RepID=UPI0033169C7F
MPTPRNTDGPGPPSSPDPTEATAHTDTPAPRTDTPQASAVRGRRAHAGPPADEHPIPQAPLGAAHEVPPAPVHQLRPRTVRAKIISLLMVPVVSLLALWGFATVTTAQDVARLREAHRLDTQVRRPVTAVIGALQAERRAATRQAAAPDSAHAAEAEQLARDTDTALAALRLDGSHTIADAGGLPKDAATRIRRLAEQTTALAAVRTAVLDRTAPWDTVYARYTDAIETALAVDGALTTTTDPQSGAHARVLLELARATEMLAREDTLLTTAQLTRDLSAAHQRQFTGAAATRRALTDTAGPDLPAAQRTAWQQLTRRTTYGQLAAAEDAVTAAAAGRRAAEAVPATTWDAAHDAVRKDLASLSHDARTPTDDPLGGVLSTAGAAVLLGAAAVIASLVISVRIGRGLVVELVTLRNTALEIARRKLPHAMRRLRAGEDIDIRAEAPPGPPARDEIAQVGEALATVHRAALGAAAERAELASGISGVFVNLARRSQVLVHRQLTLLDSMERRADDPGELGDLFRLDHLTTRMRRHAESLIILSGAAPGRAWRLPVPLTTVVRAAVSEVEDYARVEVRQLAEASVIGAAVADLTHLLAELVENAAQFSPPHTKVRVSGEPVGNGYVLEVEDRGLGMGKDALAEANQRIEQSEALDLSDSDRLGLFVVSRLSARHAIKVQLRTSPYGGTTAVVLLPTELLHHPAQPSQVTTPPREAAHNDDAPAENDIPQVSSLPTKSASRPNPQARPEPRAKPEPETEDDDAPPAPVTTLRPHTRAVRTTTESRQTAVDTAVVRGPRTATARVDATGDTAALPRRVRQASLVPQLREAPAPETPEGPSGDTPDERTPEEVRERMAAYRAGWKRGGGTKTGKPEAARTEGEPR